MIYTEYSSYVKIVGDLSNESLKFDLELRIEIMDTGSCYRYTC